MDDKNLLFYDIEVFKYDSLVVFCDITGNEVAHFWNTRGRKKMEEPSGFEGIAELVKGKTLVGYNNYSYDDNILKAMGDAETSLPDWIKSINDSIIRGEGASVPEYIKIRTLDTMQQIDVSHPSLKQIEGNMGRSIVESSIDFNIDRPLTDKEREETLEYCRNDVRNTVVVYKLRKKSYFEVKAGLVNMLPTPSETAYRWNTTTLAANILLGNDKLSQWDELRLPEGLWRNVEGIPTDVWEMWEDCTTPANILGKGKSKAINAYGCTFVFGLGGLHGAPKKPLRCKDVKHKDVASMYPSSIVRLRALGNATDVYDQMRQERIKIKHSDPVKASALKLILNSVYGNFKNKYSSLFNPLASATVCIYGQIALFSLCRDLFKAGYKIINANTDGVVYDNNPALNDVDEEICKKWEQDFPGYLLETDYYTDWIQKDVNNYIAREPNGKITVKGGDVNKYDSNKFFSNNSARIIQIAMVENLLNGIPILNTLMDHRNEPMLWQYILKAGNTYLGVQDAAGNWQNKVNRVFAASDLVEHTKLYKIRSDGGQVNFPDVPEKMFLWNDDVNDIEDFASKVDLEHYYNVVHKKLEGWPK